MDPLLEATRRVEQKHFWWRGFRRFVAPLVSAALHGVDRPRILDCGCGTGANLVLLARYGAAFGFDISMRGLGYARGYGQARVARAAITRVPFPDDTFDLVTVFDVLYSLPEDQEAAAVSEALRVLRPGGTLIVNVAALGILRGQHSVFGGEVRRSTRRRLRALLCGAGFAVERLTYTNASLFPLMLGVRTVQRVVGLATPEEAGIDVAIPSPPVNSLLSALVWCEAQALRIVDMPIGSSLLCVARKPALHEPRRDSSGRPVPAGEEPGRRKVGDKARPPGSYRGPDEVGPNEFPELMPEPGAVHPQVREFPESPADVSR